MTPPNEPAQDAPLPVQVEFAHDELAPGQARRVTRRTLIGWRLPHLIDSVVLAVSELVTNAIRHGQPPLLMELRFRPGRLRLAVHDGNPCEPVPGSGEVALDAESGRGMGIVGALADEVVVEQVPDDGKIVHVVFGTRPPLLP